MRPGGLTAICVIGLCLAVLGLFSCGTGCLGLVFQSAIQGFTAQMQQGVPGGQELQEEIAALQARWMPLSTANLVLNAVASGLLLAGSILGLKMSPRTSQIFIPGLICGILQAVAYVGLTAVMQQEMQAVMAKQMTQMMQQGPNPAAPGAAAMTSGIMKMSSAIGIAVAVAWALALIVYYGTSIWYLRRKDVRALFSPPPLDELAAEPTVGGMA